MGPIFYCVVDVVETIRVGGPAAAVAKIPNLAEGGSLSPEEMSRLNLKGLLADWPMLNNEPVPARIVRGMDGESWFIQLRVECGVAQLPLTGRPDGCHFGDFRSCLEYANANLNFYSERCGSLSGFRWSENELREFRRELLHVRHRQVALLTLNENELLIRDCEHFSALAEFTLLYGGETALTPDLRHTFERSLVLLGGLRFARALEYRCAPEAEHALETARQSLKIWNAPQSCHDGLLDLVYDTFGKDRIRHTPKLRQTIKRHFKAEDYRAIIDLWRICTGEGPTSDVKTTPALRTEPQSGGLFSEPAPPERDLRFYLRDWPWCAGVISCRMVEQQQMQFRGELSLLQFPLSGRPDGTRPYGAESMLAHIRARLKRHVERNTQVQQFKIERTDSQETLREMRQVYLRIICLLASNQLSTALRDASENIERIGLILQYSLHADSRQEAEDASQDANILQLRVKARHSLASGKAVEAFEMLEHVFKQLLHERSNDPPQGPGWRAGLKDDLESVILPALPPDSECALRFGILTAVDEEDYSRAAKLRDTLHQRERAI